MKRCSESQSRSRMDGWQGGTAKLKESINEFVQIRLRVGLEANSWQW